jgi:hypothetical protein
MSREYTGRQLLALEEKRVKRRERKKQLIESIVDMMKKDMYNYETLIFDLVKEALWKYTNKQLYEFL